MKKLLSILLTLTMLLSVAVVSVSAYDGEEEEGVLIQAMLSSDDIPYSEDFVAEKTGEYSVIGMATASFSGKITLGGKTVISFEAAVDEDDMFMVDEYIELTEGSTYTLSIDSFDGGEDDFAILFIADPSMLGSGILEEFVSTDEIPYANDFVTTSAEKYDIQIYSPVNVSGRILDENGNSVYEYSTFYEDEIYCVYDLITLSPESTYTFTIDKSDGTSEDTVDIYISESEYDETDLYYDILKYSDLPLDAVLTPDTTGKYNVTIYSPVDFSASIVNSLGETVAEFDAEYDEIEYRIYETVVFLNEGEEYHLILNASEEFDGRISVNVSEKYVDPDAILDEEIKGSDVPASFSFSSETDDFYIVSFMADDRFDWRIVDQDGNEIANKTYDPYTSGFYDSIIKAYAGVEYTLYVDNYEGVDDDEIFLSITKFDIESDEEFPVAKLITADNIPYSLDFTAPNNGIYYSEILAPSEFSASIKDKDGNVVMTLDSKLDVTSDYIASNYAYLNGGETYTFSIDSYSGNPTDVLAIGVDEIEIEEYEESILFKTFLYSDLDNGPITFEMVAEETCDYSLAIMSLSSVKYKITDENGNVLTEAETESGEYEIAFDYAAFEAGKKYYLTLEGYLDNPNGPVIATVYKSDEFDFDMIEMNYYVDGEMLTDIADILLAYHGTDTDVYVPLDTSEIGAIGQYAFENKNIESVMLEDGYEAIHNYAFLNCKELSEVYLPDGLSFIGYGAFMGCDSLTSIEIGSDIQIIEPYALGYDSDMNKIEDFVIYGYSGTAAEQYAIDNGFTFIDVEDESIDDPSDEEDPTETDPTTATVENPTDSEKTEPINAETTVKTAKPHKTTAEITTTESVNNSQGSNTNTGTKSYVLVIFIIVLAAIAVVIVIKVVQIKKQK